MLLETSRLSLHWFYNLIPFAGVCVCIGGAAAGWPLLGPCFLIAILVALSFRRRDLFQQLGLATVAALIGTGVESALIYSAVYVPQGSLPGNYLCPLWIIASWFCLGLAIPRFAPTERIGYIRIAVYGALLAPLVFLVADDVLSGAVHLRRPLWPTLLLIALLWQSLLPALCWLAQTRWYRA